MTLFYRYLFFGSVLTTPMGCAQIPIPLDDQLSKSYTPTTTQSYQDLYRVIAKRIRACYRVMGIFGNGYDVQADLHTVEQKGRVEGYYVGLTGAQKPEASRFS